ncbi:MAG TPA: hypothetical protein IAB23_03810 [Candidatus Scybalocola faecavium]|nr:hypothetical protein [Candidatus Scybalocola faecavium]
MSSKKSGGGKTAGKKITGIRKSPKKILEFYYMIPGETCAKELSRYITTVDEEKIEIWTELNLMEVIMENDSLIFQDAWKCFVDPLDQEYIQDHGIKTIYQISYDERDLPCVRQVMKELLNKAGGRICSDTDDFEPVYTLDNIDDF